jgi:hypothetical protein
MLAETPGNITVHMVISYSLMQACLRYLANEDIHVFWAGRGVLANMKDYVIDDSRETFAL